MPAGPTEYFSHLLAFCQKNHQVSVHVAYLKQNRNHILYKVIISTSINLFNHSLSISHFCAEYLCKLGDSFAAYPENNGEKWSERQWHKGTLHQKHWAAQQVLQWNKFTALLSGQWWTEYNTKRPPQIEGLQHHCIKTQEARIAYKAGRARDSFSVVHCFLCF